MRLLQYLPQLQELQLRTQETDPDAGNPRREILQEVLGQAVGQYGDEEVVPVDLIEEIMDQPGLGPDIIMIPLSSSCSFI